MTALDRAYRDGLAAQLGVAGVTATRYPAGSLEEPVYVRLDFHEKYQRIDPVTLAVSSTGPAAEMSSELDPEHLQGDQYRINGTVYYVNEVQDDGLGMVTLILSRNTQVPIAPTLLRAELNMGQIGLSWTRGAANNTAVEVWHDVDESGTFELLTTLGAAITTYAHAGASQQYRLRNINKSGPSPFSHIWNVRLMMLLDDQGNPVLDDQDETIQ